jgi:hypothetical protein
MAQKIYIGGTYNEPIYAYGTPVTLTTSNINNYCVYYNDNPSYNCGWGSSGGYWWSGNSGEDDTTAGMDWIFT